MNHDMYGEQNTVWYKENIAPKNRRYSKPSSLLSS